MKKLLYSLSMKILGLIVVFLISQSICKAQTTIFYTDDKNACYVENGNVSLQVHSITSSNNKIAVTMKINFLKKITSFRLLVPNTSNTCYLTVGGNKIQCDSWGLVGSTYLGHSHVPVSENIDVATVYDVDAGKTLSYELIFKGNLPSYKTTVSITKAGGFEYNYNEGFYLNFYNLEINGSRKHTTEYKSEYFMKRVLSLDSNNDGICGIYEVIGNSSASKVACMKYNNEYALIFISDNLGGTLWETGDIKAYLHQSASGIFKADWFMTDKSMNKDCYITFDGVSMTINQVSGKEKGETKYLKMFPTTPPSYNNHREYTPQRQQQAPQRKQTIPVLKKQNVK